MAKMLLWTMGPISVFPLLSYTMWAVMVLIDSSGLIVSLGVALQVIVTAIVLPMVLATPSMKEARIPDSAAGNLPSPPANREFLDRSFDLPTGVGIKVGEH